MAARGHIRQRSNGSYEVLVYAGKDPLTGKERRRTGTAHSRKEAEQLRTRLLSEIDKVQPSRRQPGNDGAAIGALARDRRPGPEGWATATAAPPPCASTPTSCPPQICGLSRSSPDPYLVRLREELGCQTLIPLGPVS
jgi:hypothetical protein